MENSLSANTRLAERLVTRRSLMELAGVTLVSLGLAGCKSLPGMATLAALPQADVGLATGQTIAGVPVGALNGGTKPIYVAPPGSMDPVAHSVADTLFWGEQLMEHAMFFVMLMPGPELAGPRGEAERFQRQFADHLTRLRGSRLDRSNYGAFNNTTIGLANGLISYKRRMQLAQESGQMRSLVWPSFFDHTANEAQRFVGRLAQLNIGNATFDRREVVPFWADKMEEHSLFVAHLLDPDEKALKTAAETSAGLFGKMEAAPPASKDPCSRPHKPSSTLRLPPKRASRLGRSKASSIRPSRTMSVARPCGLGMR